MDVDWNVLNGSGCFLTEYGKFCKQLCNPYGESKSAKMELSDEWLVRKFAEKVGQHDFSFKSDGKAKRIQNCGFGVTKNTTEPLNIIETRGKDCNVIVCVIQLIINSPIIMASLRMLQSTNNKTTNKNDQSDLLKPICRIIADYVLKPRKNTSNLISVASEEIMKICRMNIKMKFPWSFLKHVWNQCMMEITGFGFVMDHVVTHRRDEEDNLYDGIYRAFHSVKKTTTNLKNKILEDSLRKTKCQKQGYASIISIRLPPILMFKKCGLKVKELEDHVGLFTDSIELQDEKLIGAHDEESNGKCVYRLRSFLVRCHKLCMSYVRKDGGKSGKKILADRWYSCNNEGQCTKMNKEIFVKRNKEDEEIQDVVKVVVESTLSEVVKTAVCDDEENGIICFYEAERRKDEVLEDINPDVGIDKHMDSECGSDTEDPSRYEPKGGTNCVDDRRLYCRTCVSCKIKKVKCLGRYTGTNENEYQYTRSCPRCLEDAKRKNLVCKECRYAINEKAKRKKNKNDDIAAKTTSASEYLGPQDDTSGIDRTNSAVENDNEDDERSDSKNNRKDNDKKRKSDMSKNKTRKEKKQRFKNDKGDDSNCSRVINYYGPVHYVSGDLVSNEVSNKIEIAGDYVINQK